MSSTKVMVTILSAYLVGVSACSIPNEPDARKIDEKSTNLTVPDRQAMSPAEKVANAEIVRQIVITPAPARSIDSEILISETVAKGRVVNGARGNGFINPQTGAQAILAIVHDEQHKVVKHHKKRQPKAKNISILDRYRFGGEIGLEAGTNTYFGGYAKASLAIDRSQYSLVFARQYYLKDSASYGVMRTFIGAEYMHSVTQSWSLGVRGVGLETETISADQYRIHTKTTRNLASYLVSQMRFGRLSIDAVVSDKNSEFRIGCVTIGRLVPELAYLTEEKIVAIGVMLRH